MMMNKYIEKRRFNDYCHRYQNFIENGKLTKEWIYNYIIGNKKLKNNAISAFFQAELNVILNSLHNNDFDKLENILKIFKDIDNNFVINEQIKIKNIIICENFEKI